MHVLVHVNVPVNERLRFIHFFGDGHVYVQVHEHESRLTHYLSYAPFADVAWFAFAYDEGSLDVEGCSV